MRTRYIAVACLVLLTAAAHAQLGTWATWDVTAGGNGHEYALNAVGGSWSWHRDEANNEGAYLATLKTAAENTWVTGNVLHSTSPHWMGLYQPEGYVGDNINLGWEWVDGDPLDYDASGGTWLDWENWASDQPNGYTLIDNGGYAYVHGNGYWYDWQPGYQIYGVYERDPASSDDSPEPATWLLLAATAAAAGLRRRKR